MRIRILKLIKRTLFLFGLIITFGPVMYLIYENKNHPIKKIRKSYLKECSNKDKLKLNICLHFPPNYFTSVYYGKMSEIICQSFFFQLCDKGFTNVRNLKRHMHNCHFNVFTL